MKKIRMKVIYLLAPIFLVSCNKFLDKPPLDSVTDAGFTFSATEMEDYSNQFYTYFPSVGDYDRGIFTMDNGTDNMIPVDYNNNPQLAGTITVPSSGGGWDWSQIRAVNYFLANYHRSTDPLSETGPFIGEMYFWRAWFYFNLMEQFGDLPWYSTPLTPDSKGLTAPRISRSIITDSILADLDTAAKLLPPQNLAIPGRINRGAALCFESRVALYEGSWEKYHNGTVFGVQNPNPDKYFTIAAAAALQVMNSGLYSIANVDNDPEWGYWRLFNQEDLSNNPGIILWKKYDKSLGLYTHMQNMYGVQDVGSGMSKSLVDDYLCSDGLPISVSPLYKGDSTISDFIQNRDPRLRQTMLEKGDAMVIVNGDTTAKFNLPFLTLPPRESNTTGFQEYKGSEPTADHAGGSVTAGIIFRYAEVLLNYAEAEAELGQCTQTVLDETINKLRDRVGMPHLMVNVGFFDPNWDFPNLSPLINEIRRERRIELSCEGYRMEDLLRWNATPLIQAPRLGARLAQFAAVSNEFNPQLDPSVIPTNSQGYISPYANTPAANGFQFDPNKNYLKPIPSNELVLNPNLKQNPGY